MCCKYVYTIFVCMLCILCTMIDFLYSIHVGQYLYNLFTFSHALYIIVQYVHIFTLMVMFDSLADPICSATHAITWPIAARTSSRGRIITLWLCQNSY